MQQPPPPQQQQPPGSAVAATSSQGAQGTHNAEEIARGMRRSGKDMDIVMRKVASAEDSWTSITKQKEHAIEHLLQAQQRFEEKDKQLIDLKARYEEACKRLEERKQARDDVQKALNEATKGLNSLVAKTKEQSRNSAYWLKEISGNHTTAELAAQRGYSCSKYGTSPRVHTQQLDSTAPLGSARRPLGAAGAAAASGGGLGTATSLPSVQ
mmetsp:Transcript_137785/g.357947  ORF Transcript_137785/g.357947 Transcript_137785/m.357947 type:complete len:211 (+) Transcript_137785:226-858(+)